MNVHPLSSFLDALPSPFSTGRFLLIPQAPAQVEPSRWNLVWLFRDWATFFSYAHSPLSLALSPHWSCRVVVACLLRTVSDCLWGIVLFVASLPGPQDTFSKHYFGSSSNCVGVNAFNMPFNMFHVCFRHLLLHVSGSVVWCAGRNNESDALTKPMHGLVWDKALGSLSAAGLQQRHGIYKSYIHIGRREFQS